MEAKMYILIYPHLKNTDAKFSLVATIKKILFENKQFFFLIFIHLGQKILETITIK